MTDEEKRARRAAYMRTWTAKHRDKVNAERRARRVPKPPRQKTGPTEATRERVAAAQSMRLAGKKYHEIAAAIGCTASRARQLVGDEVGDATTDRRRYSPDDTTRECSRCHAVLPLDDEHFPNLKGKFRGWCKPCNNAADRARYEERRERLLASQAAYRAAHPDIIRERRAAKYAADPEKAKRAAKAWLDANKRKAAATKRRYRAENHEAVTIAEREKHARRKGAEGHYTAEDIRAQFETQGGRCFYCYRPLVRYHIEHKTPIARGGTNWPHNLVCACSSCNLEKGPMTAAEYIAKRLARTV